MTPEGRFKRQVLAAAKKCGCHAFPNAAEYDRGKPDIFIQHPDWPGVWIELKVDASPHRKLQLSPLQRHWMKQHQTAKGFVAALSLVQKGPHGVPSVYVTMDPDADKPEHFIQDVTTKEPINVETILHWVVNLSRARHQREVCEA
jgi:hypothetical protein